MRRKNASGYPLWRRMVLAGAIMLLASWVGWSVAGCGRKGPLKPLKKQPPKQHISHRG
jgi:predicted small lipoprotein YifL